jgi:hypothetical protein
MGGDLAFRLRLALRMCVIGSLRCPFYSGIIMIHLLGQAQYGEKPGDELILQYI